jgi:hypothetical protein
MLAASALSMRWRQFTTLEQYEEACRWPMLELDALEDSLNALDSCLTEIAYTAFPAERRHLLKRALRICRRARRQTEALFSVGRTERVVRLAMNLRRQEEALQKLLEQRRPD